ncbi:MAG: chorismate-binding protein [Bacteroidetes bacterium]|nr:chorismate-binding protein [Bacteroidota bacterium]
MNLKDISDSQPGKINLEPETLNPELKRGSIPVRITVKTILADTVTPVSMYLRLRDQFPGAVLLESADNAEGRNSRSFIAIDPVAEVKGEKEEIKIEIPSCNFHSAQKAGRGIPQILEQFISAFKPEENIPDGVVTGLIGYLGYDAIPFLEDVKFRKRNSQGEIPFLRYTLYRTIIEFDHLRHRIHLIEQLLPGDESDLSAIENSLQQHSVPKYRFHADAGERCSISEKDFLQATETAKKNCATGNIFQVVLSRKFSRKFSGDEFNVYRSLRAVNPSPYLFFADYGDYRIFGSSPEAQLQITNSKIPKSGILRATIHPIAGTFHRTGDAVADEKLEKELVADPKENAEHIMLVDLARNDLSRHARNVSVDSLREVHRYSHVIHLVSKVSGELNANANIFRVLGDTFPAGTLSGAPKIRSMQIIDELEPEARGFYGGCIGLIGFDGTMNTAIMIRSFLSKNGELHYQAGAGITINSVPEKELREIDHKLEALRQAIQSAEKISK